MASRIRVSSVGVLLAALLPWPAAAAPSGAPNGVWSHRLGDGALQSDRVRDSVVAPDGGLYLLVERETAPNPFRFAMVVVRYSPAGSIVWTNQIGTDQPFNAQAAGIHLDQEGNVYVGGIFSSPSAGLVTAGSFSPTGELRWSHLIPVDPFTDVLFSGLDSAGTLRLFGHANTGWRLWRFSSTGALTGPTAIAQPNVASIPYHADFTSDGRTFLGFINASHDGYTLRAYGPTGTLEQSDSVDLDVERVKSVIVSVNAGGEAFVGNTVSFVFSNPGLDGVALTRHNESGAAIWTRTRENPEMQSIGMEGAGLSGVEHLPDGGCVLVADSWGSEANLYDIETQRYSSDGDLLWSHRQMGARTNALDSANLVRVGADGRTYVGGVQFDSNGAHWVLLAFGPAGELEWMDRGLPSPVFSGPGSVSVGAGGQVYFAAEVLVRISRQLSQSRVLTRRFNAPVAAGGTAKLKLPATLKFPSIKSALPATKSKTLQITNPSATEHVVVTIEPLSGAFHAGGTYTVAPKEKLKLAILFRTATPGTHTATLVVTTSDPGNPGGSVQLTGAVK